MSNVLLVYKSRHDVNCDPAKVILEALSKVLVHYYPFAGRLRNAHNGKLQVECTGDGALFVEATTFDTLSVHGDMDNLKLSFQQLMFEFPPQTDISDIHPLVIQVNTPTQHHVYSPPSFTLLKKNTWNMPLNHLTVFAHSFIINVVFPIRIPNHYL